MFDVKMTGAEEVIRALAELERRSIAALQAATFTAASEAARDHLLPVIPKDSGELRDSLVVPREVPVEVALTARYADVVNKRGAHKGFVERANRAGAPVIAERVGQLLPGYAEAGVTIQNAPAIHAERPTAGARHRPRPRRRR